MVIKNISEHKFVIKVPHNFVVCCLRNYGCLLQKTPSQTFLISETVNRITWKSRSFVTEQIFYLQVERMVSLSIKTIIKKNSPWGRNYMTDIYLNLLLSWHSLFISSPLHTYTDTRRTILHWFRSRKYHSTFSLTNFTFRVLYHYI